jgi:hypothetical protein
MHIRETLALELADVDAEPLQSVTELAGLSLESLTGGQAMAELATSCLYGCSCCAACCCCCC